MKATPSSASNALPLAAQDKLPEDRQNGPDMPDWYFLATTPQERERHRGKLARLKAEGGLLIDPVQDEAGGWQVEIVTQDWEEPGLLDKIFEAILQCIQIQKGVAVRRARIFTGHQAQVVNILELEDAHGEPLTESACREVLVQLATIHKSERVVLDTIEHLNFKTLIPLLTEFPQLDNGRSPQYTYLEFKVNRLSNRFTSLLLHFLARSEFRVNIQLAEFTSGPEAAFKLLVVGKRGTKLTDDHFSRISLMLALEAMNRMIVRFNDHYVRLSWRLRQERNHTSLYLSRPRLEDALDELADILRMAGIKGYGDSLSSLVDHGLLDQRDFYLLKRFESFCLEHAKTFQRMREEGPTEEGVALARDYFELYRRAAGVVQPLFQQLAEGDPVSHTIPGHQRLHNLCRPISCEGYSLDNRMRIHLEGQIWLSQPEKAMAPFLLMARSGAAIRGDTLAAVEAALENWTPRFLAERRGGLGQTFLAILDESLRQATVAPVLRAMRQCGLLQKFVPGFSHICGLIHVIQDHTYTVDEHSFMVAEGLTSLDLFHTTFPLATPSPMRLEYEKISTAQGLALFGRNYALEVRRLQRVPLLAENPVTKPYFHLMQEVRANSLEYLTEVNLVEHGYNTCMSAIHEVERLRRILDPLISLYQSLSFADRRVLLLAALLHDLKKPARDHGPQMAPLVDETLAAMAIQLPEEDRRKIAWLVLHHLDLARLLRQIGERGEGALDDYVKAAENPHWVKLLVLFTFADRGAVYMESNKQAHDAMVLGGLLGRLA